MRIDVGQHLRLDQQMKLAPRIIQAMEILQLPLLALQERIDQELQANPVLELREPSQEDAAADADTVDTSVDRGESDLVVAENKSSEDFERLSAFSEEYGADAFEEADFTNRSRSHDSGDRDRKMDAMANTPAPDISLNDYLRQQWSFVEADAAIKTAGQYIIDNIEDDGYLRVSLEELAARTDPPPPPIEHLRMALPMIQLLDPVGVGARDLRQCLLIQLHNEAATMGSDLSLEIELVTSFLHDIEMNRLPQIAKRINKSVDQIKLAIENISRLNPRPGLLIGQRSAPVIQPDIFVTIDEKGQVNINVPESDLPRLGISKMYRKMAAEKKTDTPTRQFIQKNVRAAQWLIEAIMQRRTTVRRVAEEVFLVQRDFLERGSEALKPLPMADVAKKVGVHVATVSRAVAGKYCQTPQGIFPLRMFFSGGTTTAEGQDVSWDAVKIKLKEIVDAEDKTNPLNDDELAEALTKAGVTVARRTVAKYRGILNIPPARQRRTF